MVIESVGIVLLETDDWIVIGHSRDTVNLHPRGGFAIPKACIITRVSLDFPDEPTKET